MPSGPGSEVTSGGPEEPEVVSGDWRFRKHIWYQRGLYRGTHFERIHKKPKCSAQMGHLSVRRPWKMWGGVSTPDAVLPAFMKRMLVESVSSRARHRRADDGQLLHQQLS